MREFNLHEALSGKPVVTRDGREVTELKIFKGIDNDNPSLVGVLNNGISVWFKNGRYFEEGVNPHDLFMESEKITKWVNVFRHKILNYSFDSYAYDSESSAKNHVSSNSEMYIATALITFEI